MSKVPDQVLLPVKEPMAGRLDFGLTMIRVCARPAAKSSQDGRERF